TGGFTVMAVVTGALPSVETPSCTFALAGSPGLTGAPGIPEGTTTIRRRVGSAGSLATDEATVPSKRTTLSEAVALKLVPTIAIGASTANAVDAVPLGVSVRVMVGAGLPVLPPPVDEAETTRFTGVFGCVRVSAGGLWFSTMRCALADAPGSTD